MRNIGAPEKIRTSNPQIRSLVLYPVELRAQITEIDVLCIAYFRASKWSERTAPL